MVSLGLTGASLFHLAKQIQGAPAQTLRLCASNCLGALLELRFDSIKVPCNII
jgi:hypothetical protein